MNYTVTICIGFEIFYYDYSTYSDVGNHYENVSSIGIGNISCAIGLAFKPMDSHTQVRRHRKVLTYIYMFNLKVLNLIEYID